ncbi:hypothetical protein EU528_13820 [Candidatus Thorarchaeota archaeon]|nr:MAG: hypothetical protein EU528_13820 [Candidatus Thorarchaeota archaeon]
MIEFAEEIKDYLVQDNIQAVQTLISDLMKSYGWKEIVSLLKTVTTSLYRKHLLKTHKTVLTIFGLSELVGVDCDIFAEMGSIPEPESMEHASDLLFDNFIQVARSPFCSGGSTLFFDVTKLSATRSVLIIPDLIEARYRETIFILSEYDQLLPTLTKDWMEVSRLWRCGYGLRILKARNHGLMIHVKDYKEIRKSLAKQLGVNLEQIARERNRLIRESNSEFLQLSHELDVFILSYIVSLGVIGKFDPKYKSLIDPEDSDEF